MAGVVATALLLTGCAVTTEAPSSGPRVVTTSVVLADLVKNVGGDRVRVTSMVPAGADPHTYEPSLRSVREVAYADAAFSNYLMLESHSIIKTLDSSLRANVPNVSIAEASTKFGSQLISLVENHSLDTLWLGLRVRGSGAALGAQRSSDIGLQLRKVTGPGTVRSYVTGSFGQPKVFFDSAHGSGGQPVTLPPAAHTHMSWAFSAPGRYRLDFDSTLVTGESAARPIAAQGFDVLVGGDPADLAAVSGKQLLDRGHADITVDLDTGELYLWADETGGGERTQRRLDAADTVIHVPPRALLEIPAGPNFRFLGTPGAQTYQLPQAVLGAHVHGEIDPHLWLSVANTKAYVQVIEETLTQIDPENSQSYRSNSARYRHELNQLEDEMAARIATIAPQRRQLITTHDAYGYLAQSFGLTIAGFVTPHPGVEPSVAQRRRLATNLEQLQVPAVFLEPNLLRSSSVLAALAAETGVRVCPIYSETFDDRVPSYVAMMRFNATSLAECLS